ncbi:hypothetical protein GCM10009119_21660 [Algoriphagus jejuensis]|uniref:eCIS core domain-containing protein n=1 Tax=Algoriphagus jejuensis TaxID=419934 RepID=A0ABP3YDV9_9BACT
METQQERKKPSSSPIGQRRGSFFAPVPVQAKLTVNKPGDSYEQEADSVAEQVVSRLSQADPSLGSNKRTSSITSTATGGSASGESNPLTISKPAASNFTAVQTKCADCEAEEKDKQEDEIQRKTEPHISLQAEGDDEEESTIMAMHGLPSQPTVSSETASQLYASKGSGDPLPKNTKSEMEKGFGVDFSNVRIHTNSGAETMSKNLGAQAFTHGSDIYFNSGKYDTQSQGGKKLLAHELTHVVQQNSNNSGKIMRIPDESGIEESPPRYSFSTNCAWIDWEHANPGMTRQLIDAVQDASDRMATSGSTVPERIFAPRMESSGGPVFLSGVTPVAHIKRVLTSDEVLQVALRIFMLQSLGFEALQNWTDSIGSSSFSEEDLSSNLIAFYMAARSFNRSNVETICDVWDSARSLSKFNGYTFNKRISFHPGSLLPAGGAWPSDFSTIVPAATGGSLMDTPTALFETTLSSFSRGLGEYEMIANPSLAITSLDSGGTTIDISGTLSGSTNGPHFEVRPIVPGHSLRARWMIRDASNNRYRMRGNDESFVDHYGDQLNAYINAPTRTVLRDNGISNATVLCRVIVGREGEDATLVRLLELPVNFVW